MQLISFWKHHRTQKGWRSLPLFLSRTQVIFMNCLENSPSERAEFDYFDVVNTLTLALTKDSSNQILVNLTGHENNVPTKRLVIDPIPSILLKLVIFCKSLNTNNHSAMRK